MSGRRGVAKDQYCGAGGSLSGGRLVFWAEGILEIFKDKGWAVEINDAVAGKLSGAGWQLCLLKMLPGRWFAGTGFNLCLAGLVLW